MGFMSKKQQPVPRRRTEAAAESRERPTAEDLQARYSFRRNRTLTGSLSSDVSSANEHRAELKSARVHTHHLRKHRRHAFGALVLVAAVAGLLAFLVFQAVAKVSVLVPPGADAGVYEGAIHEYLVRNPLQRFRFSMDTNAAARYMQAHDMPEVDYIDEHIAYGGFGVAKVNVVFRQPVVVWQTAGTKMYVDADGNSFQRNYYAEPSVQVVDQTGIQTQNNQVLASNRFLSFIGKVVGRMDEHGRTVTEVILPPDTTRQVQIKIDGVAYPIKFSVDRLVGEQAEDAARAILYLQQRDITPEYLDVRISGKAFYR